MNAATATSPPMNPQDEEHFHVQREARAPAGRVERPRGGQRFDAILCDVVMPEMSRLEQP